MSLSMIWRNEMHENINAVKWFYQCLNDTKSGVLLINDWRVWLDFFIAYIGFIAVPCIVFKNIAGEFIVVDIMILM